MKSENLLILWNVEIIAQTAYVISFAIKRHISVFLFNLFIACFTSILHTNKDQSTDLHMGISHKCGGSPITFFPG